MEEKKEMLIKVVFLKNWCNKRLSPLAWQRVVLCMYPNLNGSKYRLSELEQPAASMMFGINEFNFFTKPRWKFTKRTF